MKKYGFRRYIKLLACVVLAGVILFISFFILFELKARELVHNLVDNELEIHAMKAIDEAVCDVIAENPVDYNSLIKSSENEDGKVNALYTDTAAMNLL